MVELIEDWSDPVFYQRHRGVPRPLAERLGRMGDETRTGRIGRHVYYERLSTLLALASTARGADAGTFDLEAPPSAAERQLGAVIGRAFHQGCALADVALAANLEPDRVVAIGKRTIRRTGWLDRL